MVPRSNPRELDEEDSSACSSSDSAGNPKGLLIGSYIRDPAAASSFRDTFSRIDRERSTLDHMAMSMPNNVLAQEPKGNLSSSLSSSLLQPPKAPCLRGRVGGVKSSLQEESLSTSFRHAFSKEVNFESLYTQRQHPQEQVASGSLSPQLPPINLPHCACGDEESASNNNGFSHSLPNYSSGFSKQSILQRAQNRTIGNISVHKGEGIGGVLRNEGLSSILERNGNSVGGIYSSDVEDVSVAADSLSKSLTAFEVMERSKQMPCSVPSTSYMSSGLNTLEQMSLIRNSLHTRLSSSAVSDSSIDVSTSPSSILNNLEQAAIIGSLSRTTEWALAALSTSPNEILSTSDERLYGCGSTVKLSGKTSFLPHLVGKNQDTTSRPVNHSHMYVESDYSVDSSNDFLGGCNIPEQTSTHGFYVEDESSHSPSPDALETFDMDFD